MRKSTLAVVIGTGMLTATPALADVTAYGRVTYNVINDDTSKDTYFGATFWFSFFSVEK